jgi:hypothetical protein
MSSLDLIRVWEAFDPQGIRDQANMYAALAEVNAGVDFTPEQREAIDLGVELAVSAVLSTLNDLLALSVGGDGG